MRRHFNRCEPSGFAVLGREVDHLLKQIFPGESGNACQTAPAFAARATVRETAHLFEIAIDLPGVMPEDVTVEYEEGMLVVSGERKPAMLEEGTSVLRDERVQGNFRRVFQLKEINSDAITAEFKHGVLTVVAPKPQKPTGKKVEIKVV